MAKTLLSIFVLILSSSFALAGESELLKIEKLIDQNMSKVYYISSNDGNPELIPIQNQERQILPTECRAFSESSYIVCNISLQDECGGLGGRLSIIMTQWGMKDLLNVNDNFFPILTATWDMLIMPMNGCSIDGRRPRN